MSKFQIKSSDSDLVFTLSERNGDYFTASLKASHITAEREVYAYTDAHGFADLIEQLASQPKPWQEELTWESLEGEFKISSSCTTLGQVTFKVVLSHYGCTEEWLVKTELKYEFGKLQDLASSARVFFGESPNS